MVVHIPALAAAVAGYVSAQDCEDPQQALEDSEELQQQQQQQQQQPQHQQHVTLPQSPSSIMDDTTGRSQRSVRFSGRSLATAFSCSSANAENTVRSLYSERSGISVNDEIRLKSVMSLSDDEDKEEEGKEMPFDLLNGFCDGNFASGKIKDIKLPSKCWVTAFSTESNVLAVGLENRLDFLEPRNYSCMFSLPRQGMVSAIQWCHSRWSTLNKQSLAEKGSSSSDETCGTTTTTSSKIPFSVNYNRSRDGGELIAIADFTGEVSLYHLDIALLELQGAKLLHSFQVTGQVRCMALEPCENGLLILAVGDKDGKVTISTLRRNDSDPGQLLEVHRATMDRGKDPVLGLAVNAPGSILSVSTKSGIVVVHKLVGTTGDVGDDGVAFGPEVWTTQRNGAVRSVVISRNGKQLAFGGYDKTVVLVDTHLWAIVRELPLQGTVNTIVMDPLYRYMVVGCRDKSLTFYDTSAFFPIKRFQTPGWVSSISWIVPNQHADLVAVRSENKNISLLDLTPIHSTDITLSYVEGMGSSLSWSPSGHYLARLAGECIHITDSRHSFFHVASVRLSGSKLRKIAFCPKTDEDENSTLLAAVGLDGHLYVLKFVEGEKRIDIVRTIFVEPNLWTVKWSSDGQQFAVGGREKTLTVFSATNFEKKSTVAVDGRIWAIDFTKHVKINFQGTIDTSCDMAVASGEYKAIFYDTKTMQPTLQVIRPRTVRCLAYHPNLPLLVMGDGAGIVAVVDYESEETIQEVEAGGRVNTVTFSPSGDYLLIGTDDYSFTLHETSTFKAVQIFRRQGFALSAAFSPNGKYLAIGSATDSYSIVRLGPLLGIDFVPLDTKSRHLPSWALKETLYRSGNGPSLIQRHMINGGKESIQWVAAVLKEHPEAIYSFDRSRNEGCFTTALRLRKIQILKVALTAIIDGSLEAKSTGRSILTTDIPEIGRATLENMLENHPPEYVVEILKEVTFVKVPFSKPHAVSREGKMVCASPLYLDPWQRSTHADEPSKQHEYGTVKRIPAVLPLPGLGTMKFLSALVLKAPATAFDNEAMALVLRVMWQNHIRRYFMIDTLIFLLYYVLWIDLVDSSITSPLSVSSRQRVFSVIALVLNTLFAVKEIVQSDFGRRPGYFKSVWNIFDISSIFLVYASTVSTAILGVQKSIPVAVVATLLLTVKLLSYLRAFHDTGWLVTVLNQNFQDVRGFLVVLFAMLAGFATSFRLIFANNEPFCELELDADTNNLVEACDSNPFGSLRRSFMSTFELTILGSYEPQMLQESKNTPLAILTFVLAVTCVLVVALNALISVLADSYARVQENASANRRKEKAELIVEYMTLLPRWRRRNIEENTKYFHALLEADADGDLVLDDDDWRGGLNALREDMEELSDKYGLAHQKALEELRAELQQDILTFRKEVFFVLNELSDDIKNIHRVQSEGGVTLSGKRVAGAVKAVKEISRRGTKLLIPSQK